MKKKNIENWDDYVNLTGEFLTGNMHKSRITFKYRNKRPSRGRLYVTNDNKSYYYKLTQKKDLDKLETYLSGILHMLANKPVEKKSETLIQEPKKQETKKQESKKKSKNRKK